MTFGARLQRTMRSGNLTVADLARWFDVPYQTVRGWIVHDYSPSGGELDRARLQGLCEKLEKLPMPVMLAGMSRAMKIARINKLRKVV